MCAHAALIVTMSWSLSEWASSECLFIELSSLLSMACCCHGFSLNALSAELPLGASMGKTKSAPGGRSGTSINTSPAALLCAGVLVGIALCGMYSYAFCCSITSHDGSSSAASQLQQEMSAVLSSAEVSSIVLPLATDKSKGNIDYVEGTVLKAYEDTIRSCLGGASYCFDEKVRSLTAKKEVLLDRIGLLAVPRSGEVFVKGIFDKIVASTASSSGTSTKGDPNSNIELIVSSNVPAYGYGKNHGWTRIIRLTRRLLPHALALIARGDSNSSSSAKDKEYAFATQVRQIVRWNCRLSHVAAHTKMLTIFAEDMASRPLFEMEKILTFAGVRFSRADLQQLLAAATPALQQDIAEDSSSSSSSSLLFRGIGVATLEEELYSSKNLTRWPCASFAELDRQARAKGVALSLGAAQLAPTCSGDPYVKCSVPVDLRGG